MADIENEITEYNDEEQFIVPLVVSGNMQVCQIKGKPNGIYKDVARNPFLRKTGVINNGKLDVEGIDVTPLVRYGTLEQSRIAPTLENLDIHLYCRDIKDAKTGKELHKFPYIDPNNGTGLYADTYIWREIPAGFHLYNNDATYGYEWLILQDDYTGLDGVYNLCLNIEDGKGICRIEGSRGPMILDGVDYMLIVTAKNLWNREFSLLEDFPLSTSMEVKTDATAPTVATIVNYYEKKLHTKQVHTPDLKIGVMDKEGNITDPLLFNTKDKEGNDIVEVKNLKVKEFEIEDKTIVFKEDLENHVDSLVTNPAKDKDGKIVGVHGINNAGFEGNIKAHSLDGATLSNGQKNVEKDVNEGSYIPFVDEEAKIGVGTTIGYYNESGNKRLEKTIVRRGTNLHIDEATEIADVTGIVKNLQVGDANTFSASYKTVDDVPTITFTTGSRSKEDNVTIKTNKIETNQVATDTLLMGGKELTLEDLLNSSTVALKKPVSEWMGVHWDEAANISSWALKPNRDTDVWGDPIESVDMPGLKENDNNLLIEHSLTKLGSALQALYELPMGTFNYTRDENLWKTQLGIFIERVNQYRDNLQKVNIEENADGTPASKNFMVHKRNTLMKSDNEHVLNYKEGVDITTSTDPNKNREAQNSYTYTKEEIDSLVQYFDLLTDKEELAQNIRCTVNILLKAAKETQERLLDIETNVYGWDAPTLPGNKEAKSKTVDGKIAKELQGIINNQPMFIGLNRAMRAVCLEIFNASELDEILKEAEEQVNQSDSSGRLKDKVTVMSRMDKIDELLSKLQSQLVALKKYYIREHEDTHTYTPIVRKDGSKAISDSDIEEKTIKDMGLSLECHVGSDYDEGHNWKTLASKKDIENKTTVGFAKKDVNAEKHTPDIDDCGTIRVPDYTIDPETGELILTTEEIVNKGANQNNGNNPYFKTQVVAWDSAKLERINKKLSEVTKTIYGTDDVVAKYPNRSEVLRRNITNLIDDLYPNRFFDVEKETGTDDLRIPFKKSKIANPGYGTLTEYWTNDLDKEPDEVENHKSIITWFDNALYNFTWENNYWSQGNEVLGANINKVQLSVHSMKKGSGVSSFVFDTGKLITDDVLPNSLKEDYGTYDGATSSINLLAGIVGVQDAFFKSLTDGDIWYVFGGSYNSMAYNSDFAKFYSKELGFLSIGPKTEEDKTEESKIEVYNTGTNSNDSTSKDVTDIIDPNIVRIHDAPVDNIIKATTTNTFLSRKNKSIINRLTTVEAALDAWAAWAEKTDALIHTTENDENSKVTYSKLHDGLVYEDEKLDPVKNRFEKVNILESLKDLSLKNTEEINRWFDLDIACHWGNENEINDIDVHNNEVFKKTLRWKFLKKSEYIAESVNEGNYVAYFVEKGKNTPHKVVVKYVNKAPESLENLSSDENEHFIFVPKRILNDENLNFDNFVHKITAEGTNASIFVKGGYQNETEQLMYSCMQKLFANMLNDTRELVNGIPKEAPKKGSLLYQMYLLNHPVNSVYITSHVDDKPEIRFGGEWVLIGAESLLATHTHETTVGIPTKVQDSSPNGTFGGSYNTETGTTVGGIYVSLPHGHGLTVESAKDSIKTAGSPSVFVHKRTKA